MALRSLPWTMRNYIHNILIAVDCLLNAVARGDLPR